LTKYNVNFLAQHVVALFICVAIFLALLTVHGDYDVPQDDEIRYIDYALNIATHGVFGLSDYDLARPPAPSAANAPLYPGFLGLMAGLDSELYAAFFCAGTSATPEQCPTPFNLIFAIQFTLAGTGLFFIWSWVNAAFGNARFAWLVAAGVLLCGELQDMASRFLTENFVLVLFFAFQFTFVNALQKNRLRDWLGSAVSLGLLTLTRPEYLYLAIAIAAIVSALLTAKKHWPTLGKLAASVLIFMLVLSPWAIRNKSQLDTFSLTAGGYAEAIMAYRLTFNRMTLAEWGASFVYWTPDIGDKIAEAWLPPASFERFVSKNPNSFRNTALTEVLDPLLATMPREEIVGYLLRRDVFGDFVWFSATSAALFYRGIFVGKYWGIIGFAAYLILMARLIRNRSFTLLWVSLPIWALVALHALISANVPRYNLALLSIYGVAWGWLLHALVRRFWPGELPAPFNKHIQ
jgi:hypothetical protein